MLKSRLSMTPFDTYKIYLAMKSHFTREKYDYFQYGGKTNASLDSFYKRKDRYFFEKTSRKYPDEEVKQFFVANFVESTDPQSLWIGTIARTGDTTYSAWQKRQQSLYYKFTQEIDELCKVPFAEWFTGKGHPHILQCHLRDELSIENMIILDKVFGYKKNFDKTLTDPVWEKISMKMHKYSPFLNIDILKYKTYLKEQLYE